MSITELLQKVVGKQHKRKASRLTSYRRMIHRIADGDEPPASAVAKLLDEVGKSPEQLREDVELYDRRRKLRQQVDEAERLDAKRPQLEKAIEEADKVLAEAKAEHERATAPFCSQLFDIKKAMKNADNVRRELADTCEEDVLLRQIDEANTEVRNAKRRRFDLSQKIKELHELSEANLRTAAHE